MRQDIADYVSQRGIPYLLHFTRAENVESILSHGLVPRSMIDSGQICGTTNDQARHDRRRTANCLSIAFPNSKMFYKYRMENESIEWPILAIHPNVLSHLDCMFCPTNAANSIVSSKSDDILRDLNSLRSMFEDIQFGERADYLKTYDPTDVQAEILVRDVIPPNAIFGVVFPSEPCLRQFTPIAGNRQLDTSKNRLILA